MPSLEYYDLLQLLQECRDIVDEAQSRGLPTLIEDDKTGRKIDAINKLLSWGIIDSHSAGSSRLSDRFQSVLAEVAPKLDFRHFSAHDIERVALLLSAPNLNERNDR